MYNKFIQAICSRQKIRVRFFSKEDNRVIQRVCAPLDYGPSRRAKLKNDRFHMWDYDSDTGVHALSLNPEQILGIEILDDYFDPAEIVTWDTKKSKWFIPRDWGKFS